MRLDKFLADMGLGSRKEVKGLIKKGTIEVNGQVVKSDKAQVNEFEDAVTYLEKSLRIKKIFTTFCINLQESFLLLRIIMIKP